MKNTYRLLVVDNDFDASSQLENYFSGHAVMNVIKVIEDGSEGLNYILNNKDSFDCLILDLLIIFAGIFLINVTNLLLQ